MFCQVQVTSSLNYFTAGYYLLLYIRLTLKNLIGREHSINKFTIACELDMIIYHVKLNVCLVTKPLGVFSSETKWLNTSLLFPRMNYVKNV